MIKIISVVLSLFVLSACSEAEPRFQVGDVVYHASSTAEKPVRYVIVEAGCATYSCYYNVRGERIGVQFFLESSLHSEREFKSFKKEKILK
jgi:hypothetical protein